MPQAKLSGWESIRKQKEGKEHLTCPKDSDLLSPCIQLTQLSNIGWLPIPGSYGWVVQGWSSLAPTAWRCKTGPEAWYQGRSASFQHPLNRHPGLVLVLLLPHYATSLPNLFVIFVAHLWSLYNFSISFLKCNAQNGAQLKPYIKQTNK